jgi:Fe-S cluster assembly protein SufD
MNVHAQMHTAAEKALLDAYGAVVSDLPGDAGVAVKRDAAIEQLKAGLPTKRVEAWHYTDLRRLLTKVPAFAAASAKAVAPLLEGSAVLTVVNGVAGAAKLKTDGVSVSPIADSLVDGSFAPALTVHGHDDAIGAMNAAFVSDGWFIDVAAGTDVGPPIELQNIQAGGQSHVRSAVRVGKGAKVTIVQRETGKDAALVSSVSNLLIGEGAEVLWLLVQDQPDSATQLGQFNAEIGKNAKLTLFVMNEGGKLVRQEIRVKAAGEGADFQLRGVNLLAGEIHSDMTMVLDHAVPHTGSRELVRNIVTGKAHGVFQGRINVHQIAQKTDAKMACNTLLLSDEGEFDTKPELEIFADDVVCGHGATVTEIDKNHLFYLMARGVDEKSARGLLVKSFLAEVIEELEVEPVVEALEQRLEAWFAAHV